MDSTSSQKTFEYGLALGKEIASENQQIFAEKHNFLVSRNDEVFIALATAVNGIHGITVKRSKFSIGTDVLLDSHILATIYPASTKKNLYRVFWGDPKMAQTAGLHHEDELLDNLEKVLRVVGKYVGLMLSGAAIDPNMSSWGTL